MRGENPLLAAPHVPNPADLDAASGKEEPSQGAVPQPTSAHSSLAPSDFLDHRGIVAFGFAALDAGLKHRRVECRERHLLPAAFGLFEDKPEILERLMDEALRRIFAVHHFWTLDVHH